MKYIFILLLFICLIGCATFPNEGHICYDHRTHEAWFVNDPTTCETPETTLMKYKVQKRVMFISK